MISNLHNITVMCNSYKIGKELCDKACRVLHTIAKADEERGWEDLGLDIAQYKCLARKLSMRAVF